MDLFYNPVLEVFFLNSVKKQHVTIKHMLALMSVEGIVEVTIYMEPNKENDNDIMKW